MSMAKRLLFERQDQEYARKLAAGCPGCGAALVDQPCCDCGEPLCVDCDAPLETERCRACWLRIFGKDD